MNDLVKRHVIRNFLYPQRCRNAASTEQSRYTTLLPVRFRLKLHATNPTISIAVLLAAPFHIPPTATITRNYVYA